MLTITTKPTKSGLDFMDEQDSIRGQQALQITKNILPEASPEGPLPEIIKQTEQLHGMEDLDLGQGVVQSQS